MNHLHVLIMAGGKGERFWPQSRQNLPKQFLKLKGKETLLEETLNRLIGFVPASHIWVLTNEKHVSLVSKLCPKLKKKQIIGEPIGKDTAPCIAVAASLIERKDPKAIMAVLPADHTITPKQKFQQILKEAAQTAKKSKALITLGIKPNTPHTGYGYIQTEKSISSKGKNSFYKVKAFKEKPNLPTAKKYLKNGGYYWNSGIFVWEAATILGEIKKNLPNIYLNAQKLKNAWGSKQQKKQLTASFKAFEKISIDYGILEKSKNVLMAKAPFIWDDLGSWISLSKYLYKDPSSNTTSGLIVTRETQNSILVSEKGLIATLGVRDLIVISTPDVTLVANKNKEQEIKKLLDQIRKQKKQTSFL